MRNRIVEYFETGATYTYGDGTKIKQYTLNTYSAGVKQTLKVIMKLAKNFNRITDVKKTQIIAYIVTKLFQSLVFILADVILCPLIIFCTFCAVALELLTTNWWYDAFKRPRKR